MRPDDADERIADALSGLKPHRMESYTLKTKRLKFRLHDEEFEEIRETAAALGLTVPEYFCALHRYAVKHLQLEPRSGEWVHPQPRHPRRED